MKFKVIRPFLWDGVVRMPGQILEMDVRRAERIRTMRLVGLAEQAVKPPAERTKPPEPERAVKPPLERRSRRKKKD